MTSAHTQATLARAEVLLELGRPVDAAALVRGQLAIDPNDPQLLLVLARALLAVDDYGSARAAAEAALAVAPGNALALTCLAAASAGLGDYPRALGEVQQALAILPMVAQLHRQYAAILLRSKRLEDAEAAARRGRELDPGSASIAATHALILTALRSFDAAEEAARTALQLDPNDPDAHAALARVRLFNGPPGQSLEGYREALRLDPTDETVRGEMALALKSRNPIFRGLLMFWLWLGRLPRGQRILVQLAPLLLVRVGDAVGGTFGPVALVLVGAVLVITWGTGPVMNLALLASPRDRRFLSPSQRRSALAFLACAIAAVGCFAVGVTAHPSMLIVVGVALAVWAFVFGSAHQVEGWRQRYVAIAEPVAPLLAAAAGALAAFGFDGVAIAPAALLFLGGFVGLWVVGFAT